MNLEFQQHQQYLEWIAYVPLIAWLSWAGDTECANHVFRNGVIFLIAVSAVLCFIGTVLAGPVCTLLGANETFRQMCVDYLFWYSLFISPSGLLVGMQNYCRNDGSPSLVGIAVIISAACNIFGDWLLIFPLSMGTKGAAIATGVSQTIAFLIMLIHFIRRKGVLRFGRSWMENCCVILLCMVCRKE